MTPRDRRALGYGAVAVAGAILAFRVLPWSARLALAWHAHVIEQREVLVRTQDLVSRSPAVRDSLGHALATMVALVPKLVDGRTPVEATASLTSLVSLAASRHALRVVRVDALPDSAVGVFARVAVHAELEGDIRGVASLVGALESGEPLLTVSQFAVDAPSSMTAPSSPEVLHTTLTIAGYALPRGTP